MRHVTHAAPATPHAVDTLPGWQVPSAQQPLQLAGEQTTAVPPALPPPPPLLAVPPPAELMPPLPPTPSPPVPGSMMGVFRLASVTPQLASTSTSTKSGRIG